MFMRYLGGGIGHMAIVAQPTEEGAAMNTDEDANITVNDEEAAGVQGSVPIGQSLVDELWQVARIMAGGGTADDWEDVEQAPGSESDSGSGDEDEDEDENENEDIDDEISLDGDDDEGGHSFGPEDGEDENYLDTGYDIL
jgi:hypothetical protein